MDTLQALEQRITDLEIKEALIRLDEGEYGICTACGNEIAQKRLDDLHGFAGAQALKAAAAGA